MSKRYQICLGMLGLWFILMVVTSAVLLIAHWVDPRPWQDMWANWIGITGLFGIWLVSRILRWYDERPQ